MAGGKIRDCLHCKGVASHYPEKRGTKQVETFKGKAEYHFVYRTDYGTTVGRCLTQYRCVTFCGISFVEEVDSSD